MTHRLLVVLSFDVPEPEAVGEILTAIDPPSLPHLAGVARITVEPTSTQVERWLDGEGEPPAEKPEPRTRSAFLPGPGNRAQRRAQRRS